MKAARVHEIGKIVIEDVPIPKVTENDILIKVHRVGICGTDADIVYGRLAGKFPVTLGHEFSGTIAEIGSSVLTPFQKGDRVIAGGGWGCGECEPCQNGLGNYCRNRFSMGRNINGCMAEFVKVDHRVVQKLPDNVSFDEAQATLNTAGILKAVNKISLQTVQTAVVFGPGNAGLILLQLLKMRGVDHVTMVGTRDFRLEMAKRFGAEHVVNIKKEDPVKAILQWYEGGADAVFEASGSTSAFLSSIDVVKPNGSIVVFGVITEKIKDFDPSFLYYKEPVIYGSKGSGGSYGEAVALLGENMLQISPMITHRFSLDDTAKAFKVFEEKVADALRIVIVASP